MKEKVVHHRKRTKLNWAFLFPMAAILFLLAAYGFNTMTKSNNQNPSISVSPTPAISSQEKKQIDEWVEKNDLNQYGDPKGTAYAGGNPLFNMADKSFKNRYQHIVKQHPDRPWVR